MPLSYVNSFVFTRVKAQRCDSRFRLSTGVNPGIETVKVSTLGSEGKGKWKFSTRSVGCRPGPEQEPSGQGVVRVAANDQQTTRPRRDVEARRQAGGRVAHSRVFPSAVPCLGPTKVRALFRRQSVPQSDVRFPYTFDAPDSRGQIGAEQATLCLLVCQAPHSPEPETDCTRSKEAGFEVHPIANNHSLAERRARL
jgi:hypothetical protein